MFQAKTTFLKLPVGAELGNKLSHFYQNSKAVLTVYSLYCVAMYCIVLYCVVLYIDIVVLHCALNCVLMLPVFVLGTLEIVYHWACSVLYCAILCFGVDRFCCVVHLTVFYCLQVLVLCTVKRPRWLNSFCTEHFY